MKDNKNLFVATCPCCGTILCKAKPGSVIENRCSKCKIDVAIVVDQDNRVITRQIKESA